MSNAPCDAWFKSVEPVQRSTLLALRGLVRAAAPDAVEALKWGRPCYSKAKGKVLFCYLFSTKAHATLGFHRGTALADPKGLLEGTGKHMRHIKFKPGRSPDEAAVLALIRQAAAS